MSVLSGTEKKKISEDITFRGLIMFFHQAFEAWDILLKQKFKTRNKFGINFVNGMKFLNNNHYEYCQLFFFSRQKDLEVETAAAIRAEFPELSVYIFATSALLENLQIFGGVTQHENV